MPTDKQIVETIQMMSDGALHERFRYDGPYGLGALMEVAALCVLEWARKHAEEVRGELDA